MPAKPKTKIRSLSMAQRIAVADELRAMHKDAKLAGRSVNSQVVAEQLTRALGFEVSEISVRAISHACGLPKWWNRGQHSGTTRENRMELLAEIVLLLARNAGILPADSDLPQRLIDAMPDSFADKWGYFKSEDENGHPVRNQ